MDGTSHQPTKHPLFLRHQGEEVWHLRDVKNPCLHIPLCMTRYADPTELVTAPRPVNEPICSDCATVYLNTVADDVELTASLLTTRVISSYVGRTPAMQELLCKSHSALDSFVTVRATLASVARVLLTEGLSLKTTQSLIESVVIDTFPSQAELTGERIDLVRGIINMATRGNDRQAAQEGRKGLVSWSAHLAPIGVVGGDRMIDPKCDVALKRGALLLDQKGDPIGMIVNLAVTDGYLIASGYCDEDADLSHPPVFSSSPDDRCVQSPIDPHVTVTTALRIVSVEVGHPYSDSPSPWKDPKIAFTKTSD